MQARHLAPPCLLLLLVTGAAAVAQPFGATRSDFRVNTATTFTQTSPAVAFAADGTFVIAFDDESGGQRDVYAQRFSSAADPAGAPFRVNTYTTGLHTQARLARGAEGAGSFVAVWHDTERGQFGEIYGQRFGAFGVRRGAEFRVNTGTAYQQGRQDIGADGVGNFVVVWHSAVGDGDGYGIFARRFSSTGAPLAAEFRVNTTTTRYQTYPSVAVENGGAFVVVWQSGQEVANVPTIHGQRFGLTGAPLGGEFRIDVSTGYENDRPSVVMSLFSFVVAWNEQPQEGGPPDGRHDIVARRFSTAGTALTAPFRVNTYTSSNRFTAHAALSADGSFLVTWRDTRIDGQDVFAQRFAGNGAPLGGEFRVNTYTTGSQSVYTAGANSLATDRFAFLVSWAGTPDGSMDGVHASLFCETLAGDADGSGVINVSDVLYLINNLFAGGPLPVRSADADGNGSTNVSDVLYLINYLFAGGPAPHCA